LASTALIRKAKSQNQKADSFWFELGKANSQASSGSGQHRDCKTADDCAIHPRALIGKAKSQNQKADSFWFEMGKANSQASSGSETYYGLKCALKFYGIDPDDRATIPTLSK
jgi:hypothetical protein